MSPTDRGAEQAEARAPGRGAAGPEPGKAAAELVDVLDDDGRPVGRVSRAEMRAGNLLHRTVFVVVVTTADEVVVHQRAPWKDVFPSYWDLCFGGVVGAGEGWEAAAARELGEEAGVDVAPADLELLAEDRYETAEVRELARIYRVRHDGPFRFLDGEVVATARVPMADLAPWIATRDVCDDSVALVLPRLAARSGS